MVVTDFNSGADMPAPGRPRRRLTLLTAGIAGAAVLLLGGAAAFAMAALLHKPASLERMVPASVDTYAVIYVDPSVGQKLNLYQVATKFPGIKSQADIEAKIDDSLKQALPGAGISYTKDVKPWLGSEVAVGVKDATSPPTLVLADSRDDTKALAFVAKVRAAQLSSGYTWTTTTYQGVDLNVGKSSVDGRPDAVYGLTGHTLLIGSTLQLVEDAIDAGNGAKPRLIDTDGYKLVASHMAGDRLFFAYADGSRLGSFARGAISRSALPVAAPSSLGGLDAVRGVGFDVVARADGIQADVDMETDASKLDPATKAMLAAGAGQLKSLGWVPSNSFGVFALQPLKQTVQALIAAGQSGSPDLAATLAGTGLTGPDGIAGHLGQDLAFEVGPGPLAPGGALLIATDSETVMKGFFDRALVQGLALAGGSGSAPAPTTYDYKGVTVTYAPLSGVGPAGLELAYAVTGGYGIVATSRDEIQAVIDAHLTGASITGSSRFNAAAPGAAGARGLVYVDVESAVRTLRGLVPADPASGLGGALDGLAPVKALVVTSTADPDRSTERFVVLIG